jgi:hypothetical protein
VSQDVFHLLRPEIRRVKVHGAKGVYEVWDCDGHVSIVTPRCLYALRGRPVVSVREREGRYAVEVLTTDSVTDGMVVGERGAVQLARVLQLQGQPVDG